MQPIPAIPDHQRRVKNLLNDGFEPFVLRGEVCEGESVLQVDDKAPLGAGFHVYRMAPGAVTTAHVHESDEHFLVLDGELVDHDGFVYRTGDLVMAGEGHPAQLFEQGRLHVGGVHRQPRDAAAEFLSTPAAPTKRLLGASRRLDAVHAHQGQRRNEYRHREPRRRAMALPEDHHAPRDSGEQGNEGTE